MTVDKIRVNHQLQMIKKDLDYAINDIRARFYADEAMGRTYALSQLGLINQKQFDYINHHICHRKTIDIEELIELDKEIKQR